MQLFKYPEDRLTILVAVGITALDFTMYFTTSSPWLLAAYWLVMVMPKGVLSSWNHHHQHVPTFRSVALNRLLELCYALHTGMTTNAWVLHHVLGHHQNFLDQTKDESRWKRRDGTTMGVAEYTLSVALTAYPRAYRVGRRFPQHQRPFLIYGALTVALVAALVAFKPLAGLLLFVLPMFVSLLWTAWATYDQHAGLDTTNEFEATVNDLSKTYNFWTGNLGYHTAHHYRQGVHWSKLPELHARIAHRIPVHLYKQRTTFAALFGSESTPEPLEDEDALQQPEAAE